MIEPRRFQVAFDGLQEAFKHPVGEFVAKAYYQAFKAANMDGAAIEIACQLAIANLTGYGRIPPAAQIIDGYRVHRQQAAAQHPQLKSATDACPPPPGADYRRVRPHAEQDVQAWMERDRQLLEQAKARVAAQLSQRQEDSAQAQQATIERVEEGRKKAAQFTTYLALGGQIPTLAEVLAGRADGDQEVAP